MEDENQWSVDKINKHSPSRKNYEWCSEPTLGSTASALHGWCGIRCGPPGKDRASLGHREPWFCLNRHSVERSRASAQSLQCQKVVFFFDHATVIKCTVASWRLVKPTSSGISRHWQLYVLWPYYTPWSSTPPFDSDTLVWPLGHWFELFTLATGNGLRQHPFTHTITPPVWLPIFTTHWRGRLSFNGSVGNVAGSYFKLPESRADKQPSNWRNCEALTFFPNESLDKEDLSNVMMAQLKSK